MPKETVAESRRGLGEDIGAVIRELDARGRSEDDKKAFARALFARGAAEDLARYSAPDLARLADQAFAFLVRREAGAPKLRLYDPEPRGQPTLSHVTVLEIVNDNMPFLVDSVMGELTERGLEIRLVLHPILRVTRDARGRLRGLKDAGPDADGTDARESLIHIHLERIADDAARTELEAALALVLGDVRSAVEDWPEMLARLEGAIEDFGAAPPPVSPADTTEAVQFLEWLKGHNFTFLGMRQYGFIGGTKTGRLRSDPKSGLGILRDPDVRVLRQGRELVTVTPEIRAFLQEPVPLIITKANIRSRVHRRVHMDYVGVKIFDAKGRLSGELRIVGLFTSTAYTRSARDIPILRRKVADVLARAGFDPASHSGKSLINVLETFPRDELFQIDPDTLFRFAIAILHLEERPRVRVLARRDRFARFVSLIVFVPRERFSTEIRLRIGAHLASVFRGRVSAAYPDLSMGPLARVHYIIGRGDEDLATIEQGALEADVADIVTTWSDRLRRALVQAHGPEAASALLARYGQGFEPGYLDSFTAEAALEDIARFEALSETRAIVFDFHRRGIEDERRVGLKLHHRGAPVPLSTRVPILENMGFRSVAERTFRITPHGAAREDRIFLHDMLLESADGQPIDQASLDARLEDVLGAVWAGRAENDGYNALVLRGGLVWRDVAVLRAVSRYLRQALVPFDQDYMWATLVRHYRIAVDIAALFHARLDPDARDDAAAAALLARIEAALADVTSLDEDRILRRFVNVVESCLRSNVFQPEPDGAAKATFAFKLDSRKVEGLPAPRPMVEIFVYGPSVEGVHMRYGKVARGGIRWSDRPQDFRTEVLGLAKAQQVKNAVIVPVGAKGGFVPKTAPADASREAFLANGIAAYQTFVGALLDVTDNLDATRTVPPERVVRRDGDDPYLVVAADKGTATFSDIANAISVARGYWLGDAFASGGSAGYDHKRIGITARGAWEAVKRHFRERGIDIQATPFTVAGVGDMSGDVFGNGMLLSDRIRLVAAFDHRDIFIDPDPDPARGIAERRRLFALPRSSWQDYDKALISKGGGVFPRALKSVPLSPEMKVLLGLDKASAAPAEIMNAILKADVDLLWFGGIGTYVRASSETDEQIGDRANDAIRVTGASLRATVVGEGANLGMSQSGRIEYARAGGRLNSDAIDNSAGVNTSDVEVNIKIALSPLEASGKLKRPARDRLLAAMTEDVAALVLRNNYQQTLALSLAERRGPEDLGFARRMMQVLERRGLLDRAVEALPDDARIAELSTRGEALTRPENAVLLAYGKIALYGDLLLSDMPDDPYLSRELERYFPERLRKAHRGAIESHRLRREIIATLLANSMINRGGPTLITRISDQTGADSGLVARAFAAVRDSFDMVSLNGEIDALDGRVAGDVQLDLYAGVQALLLGQIVWFLRHAPLEGGLAKVIERYAGGIADFAEGLPKALPEALAAARLARIDSLGEAGVPATLARRMADLDYLAHAPDVIGIAAETRVPLSRAALTFFAVGERFALDRISGAAHAIEVEDYFERLAIDRVVERLEAARRRLTRAALATGKQGRPAVEAWIGVREQVVTRTHAMVSEIAADPAPSLAKLSVATSLLADMVPD